MHELGNGVKVSYFHNSILFLHSEGHGRFVDIVIVVNTINYCSACALKRYSLVFLCVMHNISYWLR